MSVVLLSIDHPDLRVTLTARITPDGDLELSGHDLGRRVEEMWGRDEYEYWLTVARGDLAAVGDALAEAYENVAPVLRREGLLAALQQLFANGTFPHDAAFRAWLGEQCIPSRFHSYP